MHNLAPSLLVLDLVSVLEVHIDGHDLRDIPAQLAPVRGVNPLEDLGVNVEHLLEEGEQLEGKVGQLGPVGTPVQEYVRLEVVPVGRVLVLPLLVVGRQLVHGGQHLLHLLAVLAVHG